jgi:hypothetical protein
VRRPGAIRRAATAALSTLRAAAAIAPDSF